jgi:hypothetical protein
MDRLGYMTILSLVSQQNHNVKQTHFSHYELFQS